MKTNVESHYSQEKLFEKIIKAFSIAGKDIQHSTSSDFNIFDQFHSMGKETFIIISKPRMIWPPRSLNSELKT